MNTENQFENNQGENPQAQAESKKAYLNNLLGAGLIIGLLYTSAIYILYIANGNTTLGWVMQVVQLGILAAGLVYYGKRAAAIKDYNGFGFTFGQAFGFSMLTLIGVAIIAGLGQWILQTVIDPQYFDQQFNLMLQNMMETQNLSTQMVDTMKKSREMMNNPLVIIFGNIISTCLIGGIIALIASPFIKRNPRF